MQKTHESPGPGAYNTSEPLIKNSHSFSKKGLGGFASRVNSTITLHQQTPNRTPNL